MRCLPFLSQRMVRAGDVPWPKVQRRIAQLIKEDRFYTEAEQDRFDNIDPHRHPGGPGRARHRERPGGGPGKAGQ